MPDSDSILLQSNSENMKGYLLYSLLCYHHRATTAARADLLWCVLDKCVTCWVVGQISPTFLYVYNFLMVVCLFIVSLCVCVCVCLCINKKKKKKKKKKKRHFLRPKSFCMPESLIGSWWRPNTTSSIKLRIWPYHNNYLRVDGQVRSKEPSGVVIGLPFSFERK